MISRVKKRNNKLKFSWPLLMKMTCFIVLAICTYFAVNQFKQAQYFPIKTVKVAGLHHLDYEEVRSSVMPFVSHGFFAVDVDAIKNKLKQLPWVSEIAVRRIWPDQILVTVLEKNAIARWNDKSILSSRGELFNPTHGVSKTELPQLVGPEGQQMLLAQYFLQINNLLTSLHFRVARLELTPSQSWLLILNNGMKLNIGYKDVLTRISHFVKVYPKIVGNRAADVEYVDLRYSNGVAVKWKSAG